MEIDIEALIAAKREEREKKIQAQNDNELERRARRIERQKERAEYEDQRLREHAVFIADRLAEYSPELLEDWFILDHWTVEEALILLAGFSPKHIPLDEDGRVNIPLYFDEDPWADGGAILHKEVAGKRVMLSRIRRLDGLDLFGKFTFQILGVSRIASISADLSFLHNSLLRIWKSGSHTESRYPPKYFIDWAVSKKVPVRWLDWAKAEGYYGERPKEGGVQDMGNGKDVSPKSEAAYLNIIGALGELYWSAAHPGQEYSQAALLAALKPYEGFAGMSERNLKDKLTKAIRAIKS